MGKNRKKEPITLDVWSVIKQRVHLLKIGLVPLILIFIGIYLLMRSSQSLYMSDQDYLLNTVGLIIGLIGLISLIIVFVVSGMRTFKQWDIVKKQKEHLKNQQHPRAYTMLFILLIIGIFIRVYFTGREGFEEISRFVDWLISLTVLWSVFIFIKNKLQKNK